MATITVLKLNSEDDAEQALALIKNLARQHLINLQDAALVSWPKGKQKPQTKQLSNLPGSGTLDEAFWGMLFSLIFFMPLLTMPAGTTRAALADSFSNVGIDDHFINLVRDKVTEGTSVLFLMTSNAVVDKVVKPMQAIDFELIASNLSKEQEAQLNLAFVHH